MRQLSALQLVMALASPIIEEDRPRYLAALERLPKGSGRQTLDIIRDKLDARGIALLRHSELVL